jgi:hypothetical protein
MTKQINVGDIVAVNFNGAQLTLCHEARVDYMPCATGDSWQFYDLRTKKLHWVSEGCTISLIRKGTDA